MRVERKRGRRGVNTAINTILGSMQEGGEGGRVWGTGGTSTRIHLEGVGVVYLTINSWLVGSVWILRRSKHMLGWVEWKTSQH